MKAGDALMAKIDDLGIADDSFHEKCTIESIPAQKAVQCLGFFFGRWPSKNNAKAVENGSYQEQDKRYGKVR